MPDEQRPAFVTAAPHATGGGVVDTDSIKKLLVQQIIAPVRWYQSIETLRAKGVTNWHEIGPGRTLTGMMRKIDRKAPIQNYSSADGLVTQGA